VCVVQGRSDWTCNERKVEFERVSISGVWFRAGPIGLATNQDIDFERGELKSQKANVWFRAGPIGLVDRRKISDWTCNESRCRFRTWRMKSQKANVWFRAGPIGLVDRRKISDS
jgi:hypothetical protein